MGRLFSKKTMAVFGGLLGMMIIGAFVMTTTQSFASNDGYFGGYDAIKSINLDSNYTSSQGFHIHKNEAYYVKIANKGTAKSGNSRIWVYDLQSKTNKVVYNGNSNNAEFQIGHANCIYVNAGYMYIATQESNKPSVCRYKISTNGDKRYLYDREDYTVYSDTAGTKISAVTGINFAPDLGGFLLKNGNHVYLGNFTNDKFVWTKHFTLNTNITVGTKNGTETINTNDFTKQGMFYKKGKIYMPMVKTNKQNQSLVVVYDINQNTPNNSVLKEDSNTFIRITSNEYGKLFEIEDVAYYNGQMYANTNATYTRGGSNDMLIKIKDFTF